MSISDKSEMLAASGKSYGDIASHAIINDLESFDAAVESLWAKLYAPLYPGKP
jgi:hypothetical protein